MKITKNWFKEIKDIQKSLSLPNKDSAKNFKNLLLGLDLKSSLASAEATLLSSLSRKESEDTSTQRLSNDR